MTPRPRTVVGLSLLTLLPLLLMTPASADGPNLPPVPPVTVQVDPPPPPSADPDLATNYGSLIHGDLPPDDAVAGNLLPDPNAPWPAPYVTVEDPTPVKAPNDGSNTCDCPNTYGERRALVQLRAGSFRQWEKHIVADLAPIPNVERAHPQAF